jgi:NAD/NADP transhydrogenase alpha subunit
MPKQSLEARVAVLERAVASALGFSLEQFDPEAVQAKQEAEAKAAEERERIDKARKDVQSAHYAAQAEADAIARAEEVVRAQELLDAENKKTKKK